MRYGEGVPALPIYDRDIRQALIKELGVIPEFATSDSLLVPELDVCGGTARVDLAVINGRLHGFEIKSQQDNLERLPFQSEQYNKVFDTMTAVVTDCHVNRVYDIVPAWWGVYVATETNERLGLTWDRQPQTNLNIDKFQLARLLWRDELLQLLAQTARITSRVKSKSRPQLARLLCESISEEVLRKGVRATLKRRRGWKAVQSLQTHGG